MKTIASILLMWSLGGSARAAEPLVNAPQPNAMGITDWSLAGGLLAGRIADWSSTQSVLRHGGREIVLPNALAHSKVGLGAFEAGAAGLEMFSQYQLTKHGHRRLARAVASVNIGLSFAVDAHNYREVK